jgi:hypothetical protein
MSLQFLATPSGVKLVAAVTVMLIAFAFLLGLRISSPRQRRSVSSSKMATVEEPKLWLAGDYFIFINSLVLASKTWADLDKAMVHVENYRDKKFREPIGSAELERYYERLLDSYDSKVIEFEKTIPVEVCKN